MSKTVQGRNGAHSKASKRRKKQKNRLIIVVIEILVLLILAAVLFVTVKLSKIQKDTSFNKEDIEVNEGLSSESQEIMAGYTTIALFGLDNRSNGNLSKGNSDVIMIASINNDTHAVKLVSVYRDSYLDIGGGTFKKCNSAQKIYTFNKLTKNNSKYLSGGGTNVEMDGVQACAYARIRYTTGDDYKRTERQRTVLTAMVQKAQKANLTTINSLIDELFGDIKTSFSNTELISLAAKVFNYSLGETIGFPFEKNTTTLGNKGSVVVPCDLESNVKQLHVFLYDDNEYAPTDTVKNNSAQIVNDTGFHQGEGY